MLGRSIGSRVRQGDADYIGEDISQLEHCLQAAASATKSGGF